MATPHVDVPVPPIPRSYIRVVWARQGQTVKAVSFSPRVVGRWMHWCDGRTQLCLQPDAHCAWCHARQVKTWYGWLYGRDMLDLAPALIQLTAQCVRKCLLLSDSGIDLRGAQISLTREQGPKNAAVIAHVELQRYTRGLPEVEPDVLAHLQRFYKAPFYPEGRHDVDELPEVIE